MHAFGHKVGPEDFEAAHHTRVWTRQRGRNARHGADIHARRHRGPAGAGRGRRASGPAGFLGRRPSRTAVREARERVRAAIANCDFDFPLRRIVANLAPASLRKAGPGLDLPIAVALLVASGQLEWERLPRLAMAGELALDGTVRPIPGVLAIAEAAREQGAEALVVPAENGPEAALVGGIEVLPLDHLAQIPELAAG